MGTGKRLSTFFEFFNLGEFIGKSPKNEASGSKNEIFFIKIKMLQNEVILNQPNGLNGIKGYFQEYLTIFIKQAYKAYSRD